MNKSSHHRYFHHPAKKVTFVEELKLYLCFILTEQAFLASTSEGFKSTTRSAACNMTHS
jgi:hypothetical protein